MLHHSCFTEMSKLTFNNLRTNTDAKKNELARITDISYFRFPAILKNKFCFFLGLMPSKKKMNLKID